MAPKNDIEKLELTALEQCDLKHQVHQALQSCSNGHQDSAAIQGIYEDFVIFMCMQCEEHWAICRLCTTARSKLLSRKAVWDHKSKRHKKQKTGEAKQKSDQDSNIDTTRESPIQESPNESDHNSPDEWLAPEENNCALMNAEATVPEQQHNETSLQITSAAMFSYHNIPFQSITTNCTAGFKTKRNKAFFEFCQTRNSETTLFDAGIEYLTTRCLLNKFLNPREIRALCPIPLDFKTMLVQYAFLTFRSGSRDRSLLCEVVRKLHSLGMQDGWHSSAESINKKFDEEHPIHLGGNDYIKNRIATPFDKSHSYEYATHNFSYQFPTTPKEIRSMFAENEHSIVQCLPYPEVHSEITNHAYLSLEACIRDALGFSACRMQVIDPFPKEFVNKMKWMFATDDNDDSGNKRHHSNYPEETLPESIYHPSRSKRACEILGCTPTSDNISSADQSQDNTTKTCYVYFWSDDCDTNSSVMSGRANVWIKSMTIGGPTKYGNWLGNTYPVAIGSKSESHDDVEAKHAEELEKLLSTTLQPFYVGDINRMVRCRFGVMANLGDQPEKRTNHGLLLGKSTWGARSFVSANHKYLYPKLKACRRCLDVMRNRINEGCTNQPLPTCADCLNWEVLNSDSDLNMVPIPADYPYPGAKIVRNKKEQQQTIQMSGEVDRITIDASGERFIKPFQITYDGLRAAVKEAHLGYCENNWDATTCKVFLNVECFNGKTIILFLEYAKRAKALKTRDEDIDPILKAAIDELFLESPELFSEMNLPSLCRRQGVEISTHVEGIMHLLALGVIKRVMTEIQKSLTNKSGNTEFLRVHGTLLDNLLALNLEWLKLLPYLGGKFNGWNAINYLGFARLTPWFYQNYNEIGKEPLPVQILPPDDQLHLWKVDDFKYWLRIRGEKLSGKKKELQERVAGMMAQKDPPQPLPQVDVDVEQIQAVVNSLYDMLGCLLADGVSECIILKAEHTIRIFLSSFDELDVVMSKNNNDKTPSVVSVYNFSCLTALTETMRSQGPLRHLWEGKIQGEGLLPYVKQQHQQGIRKNWSVNLLHNILRERSFNNLLGNNAAEYPSQLAGENNSTEFMQEVTTGKDLDNYKDRFYTYKCIDDVLHVLRRSKREKKKPLSIVILTDLMNVTNTKLYAVVGQTDQVVELLLDGGGTDGKNGTEMLGQHYYQFDVPCSDMTMDWDDERRSFHSPQAEFALLLPLLEDNEAEGTPETLFAVVSRNWQRLGASNTLHNLVVGVQ